MLTFILLSAPLLATLAVAPFLTAGLPLHPDTGCMSQETFLYLMSVHRPKQSIITHLLTFHALQDPLHKGAAKLTMKCVMRGRGQDCLPPPLRLPPCRLRPSCLRLSLNVCPRRLVSSHPASLSSCLAPTSTTGGRSHRPPRPHGGVPAFARELPP